MGKEIKGTYFNEYTQREYSYNEFGHRINKRRQPFSEQQQQQRELTTHGNDEQDYRKNKPHNRHNKNRKKNKSNDKSSSSYSPNKQSRSKDANNNVNNADNNYVSFDIESMKVTSAPQFKSSSYCSSVDIETRIKFEKFVHLINKLKIGRDPILCVFDLEFEDKFF